MLEVIILSIVQGVTEFLPISSSAHLILVSKYFNFNNQNLTLDVSLHFGSLLAIIFYFKKDLLDFVNNKKLYYIFSDHFCNLEKYKTNRYASIRDENSREVYSEQYPKK